MLNNWSLQTRRSFYNAPRFWFGPPQFATVQDPIFDEPVSQEEHTQGKGFPLEQNSWSLYSAIRLVLHLNKQALALPQLIGIRICWVPREINSATSRLHLVQLKPCILAQTQMLPSIFLTVDSYPDAMWRAGKVPYFVLVSLSLLLTNTWHLAPTRAYNLLSRPWFFLCFSIFVFRFRAKEQNYSPVLKPVFILDSEREVKQESVHQRRSNLCKLCIQDSEMTTNAPAGEDVFDERGFCRVCRKKDYHHRVYTCSRPIVGPTGQVHRCDGECVYRAHARGLRTLCVRCPHCNLPPLNRKKVFVTTNPDVE